MNAMRPAYSTLVLFLALSLGLTTTAVSAPVAPGPNLKWHWVNPYPTGNDLFSVAYGAGKFLAVDRAGNLLESSDGSQWAFNAFTNVSPICNILYANGAFLLASADQTCLFSSPDGSSWVRHPIPIPCYRLFYGGGKYLIASLNLLSASDLDHWTQTTAQLNWTGIAYGNGRFVAFDQVEAGQTTKVLVSTNAIDWEDRSTDALSLMSGLCFGNGLFVATDEVGDAWTSVDGESWTTQTIELQTHEASFVDGRFLVVGDNRDPGGAGAGLLITSTDGFTWSQPDVEMRYPLRSVAGGDGKFVAVGDVGEIVTSTNGTVWQSQTRRQLPKSGLTSVAFGNERFVAVGGGGAVSLDGKAWTPTLPGLALRRVIFDGSRFIAVGYWGIVAWSADGVSWDSAVIDQDWDFADLAFGAGVYVAASLARQDGTGQGGILKASTNLSDWITAYQSPTHRFAGVTFGGDRFVANTLAERWVYTSTNGIDWTPGGIQRPGLARPVFSNGMFYSVNGSSTNGARWLYPIAPVIEYPDDPLDLLYGLEEFAGVFIAMDNHPTAATWPSGKYIAFGLWDSFDVAHWQPSVLVNSPLTGATHGKGTFVVVGEGDVILQSEPLPDLNPITLTALRLDRLHLQLTIHSAPGITLNLESSTNLDSWQLLDTLTNTPGSIAINQPIPLTNSHTFYRARANSTP